MRTSFPYEPTGTALLHAPATERNREPILAVLQRWLPPRGRVLEVGCGTGEHAVFFASAFPALSWLPTDAEHAGLHSVRAHRERANVSNVEEPVLLDLLAPQLPALPPFDALFCANVLHIAPPEALPALVRLAAQLPTNGVALIYGPFARDGVLAPESNVAFDRWLKERDPRFGVRDSSELERVANAHGLVLEAIEPMPANNQSLVFRRR